VVLAWALAAELERRGALDRAFIEQHVAGFEAFMAGARRYSVADAARICQVPEAQIRQLAEWYHTLSPASISVGNGLERNQNGGSGIRAIFALPALAGKFGVPGGGLVNGAGFVFPKTPAKLQRPDLVPPGTRTLNIVDVGAHLLDPALSPPIKALFVYNHNPLVVHPDQNRMRRGLAREDLFVVGCDVVMTDSLAYADVVLPASSHFEYHDLYAAYGQHWLQRAEPAIPSQHQSLPTPRSSGGWPRYGFTDPSSASDAQRWTTRWTADPRLGVASPRRRPRHRCGSATRDPLQERRPKTARRWAASVPRRSTGSGSRPPGYETRAADPHHPRLGRAHHLHVRGAWAATRRRRSRCIPTTRGRRPADGVRARVWNELAGTCRSPSRTRCGRAWCPRSRARGSRRATMARRSPRSRPATPPISPGPGARGSTRADPWPV
jgi:hypothetical protein